MAIDAVITCRNCGKENSFSASTCVQCGKPLDRNMTLMTRLISPTENSAAPIPHSQHVGKLSPQGVALYISTYAEPLIVTLKNKATLGRKRDLAEPDLIDLTAYDAYRLGLSRNHAVMFFKDVSLCIQDIGSANGTWLNGVRLQPYDVVALIPGSTISLARLPMVVYY